VFLRKGSREEQKLNVAIGSLISKHLSDFDNMRDPEVNAYRRDVLAECVVSRETEWTACVGVCVCSRLSVQTAHPALCRSSRSRGGKAIRYCARCTATRRRTTQARCRRT
jgi:hypothetical protein